MAMKKIYDLAVKVGEYTTKSGETKGKYENIGEVMEKDDGGKLIFLKRTFNPAGVTVQDGRENILVSMFEPRNNDGQQQQSGNSQKPKPKFDDIGDDDLPF